MKQWTPEHAEPLRRRRPLAALALTLALAVTAASGDEAEQQFFAEMPLVLTGSRLPQSLLETPGAVTVLDRETLRATGYRRLPDLLRLVPGFNVGWVRGWWGVVNYHGLSGEYPNRVLVLVDDRPVNSEIWNGASFWPGLPVDIDDIERIEVLRGSNSTNFGTNAFLGVINIRTRMALQGGGSGIRVSAGDGIGDAALRATAGDETAAVRVSLARVADRGLADLHDDRRGTHLQVRADARPGPHDEIAAWFGAAHGKDGEGYAGVPLAPEREQRTHTGFVQLRWRHSPDAEHEITVQAYSNRETLRDAADVVVAGLPQPVSIDQNRDAGRDSLEFQQRLRASAALRLAWGLEARREQTRSRVLFGKEAAIRATTRRLFGHAEWRPTQRLLINAGAMVERVSHAGTRVSPRAFANFELFPEHVLRAGLSTATRAPTLFESFADRRTSAQGVPLDVFIIGNPQLHPERIRAQEIGYFGRAFANRLEADLRWYRERLSELVVGFPVTRSPLVFTGINADSAVVRGLALQLRARPWAGGELMFGHDRVRISNSNPRVAASAPTAATSLAWLQRFGETWSLSLIHTRSSGMDWLDSGTRVGRQRATDARLAWHFNAAAGKGELSLAAQNLFADASDPFSRLPGAPAARTLFATLRLER